MMLDKSNRAQEFSTLYGIREEESSHKPSTLFQKVAAFLAMVGAGTSVCLVSYWASNKDTQNGYLGGLNWKEQIFNWHPVLMISGLLFCFIYALVSFRTFNFGKRINKIIHGTFHTASLICCGIGLYAVIYRNNHPEANTSFTGYIPNLFSLHSYLGLTALALYFQNYILGFGIFLFPGAPSYIRRVYLPRHILIGMLTLIAVGAAISAGIMELSSCYFPVTTADTNPVSHYGDQTAGCHIANALGVVVVITVLCCAAALIDIPVPPDTSKPATDAEARLLA